MEKSLFYKYCCNCTINVQWNPGSSTLWLLHQATMELYIHREKCSVNILNYLFPQTKCNSPLPPQGLGKLNNILESWFTYHCKPWPNKPELQCQFKHSFEYNTLKLNRVECQRICCRDIWPIVTVFISRGLEVWIKLLVKTQNEQYIMPCLLKKIYRLTICMFRLLVWRTIKNVWILVFQY